MFISEKRFLLLQCNTLAELQKLKTTHFNYKNFKLHILIKINHWILYYKVKIKSLSHWYNLHISNHGLSLKRFCIINLNYEVQITAYEIQHNK